MRRWKDLFKKVSKKHIDTKRKNKKEVEEGVHVNTREFIKKWK